MQSHPLYRMRFGKYHAGLIIRLCCSDQENGTVTCRKAIRWMDGLIHSLVYSIHVQCRLRKTCEIGGHMTIIMQQLGGFPRKLFRIRCSEIASETIPGPKLASTLTRTSSSSSHA